uniref:Zinc finger protein 512 n=1 Tax=Neogobius melanostomus TaxID=47308 RepID=A0A8C6TWB9_9GOBI
MTVSGPNAAVAGPSGVQSSPEPKPSPAPGKKEPPVYAPGSPEEQWQLQIEAKGRVTCPRCKSVCRKTVEGLKKHMDNCKAEPYSCPHCGKQLKTNTGMKYHIMADHSLLPSSDANDSDHRATKEELRKILKRLGRLKCSREGCTAGFTSVMGYFYHMRTCGKAQDELQKLVLSCSHCGKNYKSKAGLEYHTRNEHAPVSAAPESAEQQTQPLDDLSPEPSSCGRAKRASAQAASLQLAQIAQIELPKDWGKRKFTSDLVPEDHKVRESNPQPRSQDVLKKWRSEVKVYRKVQCPNQGCGCTYTSVSGLKAHLGLCNKGDFAAGKYRCLICNKEFNSESGVKYHINSIHEQSPRPPPNRTCLEHLPREAARRQRLYSELLPGN